MIKQYRYTVQNEEKASQILMDHVHSVVNDPVQIDFMHLL